MNTTRHTNPWMLFSVSLVSLAAGALLMGQNTLVGRQPAVVPKPEVRVARQLSEDFRRVVQAALPAVVSIETRQKPSGGDNQLQRGESNPLEGSPFGELFKNDPRFREYFGNTPRRREVVRGMGSGFVVDPSGIIITNSHVVADADNVRVRFHNGAEYVATDIKADPRTDVAIVRIKPRAPLVALKLSDSDDTQVGDLVLAVGNPFGLDSSVTNGIISATGRGPGIADREDFIQTDAAVNPGNSGGPLLNMDGEVIGMNTAISSRGGGFDGVSFAVPANLIHWVSQHLIETGKVERGYLGVMIQPVTNDLAEQFKIPVGQGAIVGQVMPASPAADAGLEAGDVVLTLDGKQVASPRILQGIVEQLKIGDKYTMVVLRNGKKMDVPVTIRELPSDKTTASAGDKSTQEEAKDSQASEFKELGVEVEDLKPEIAKELGFDSGTHGVVITSVNPSSPAAETGLGAGMVIEKVGAKQIESLADFQEAMKSVSLDKGVLLLVRTTNGSRFVVVRNN